MSRAAVMKPKPHASKPAVPLAFTVRQVLPTEPPYSRGRERPEEYKDSANVKEAIAKIADELRDFLHKPLAGRIVPRHGSSSSTVGDIINLPGYAQVRLNEYYLATITIPDVNRLRNPSYRETMLKPARVALLDALAKATVNRTIAMAQLWAPHEYVDSVGVVSTDGYIAVRAIVGYDWDINTYRLILEVLFGMVEEKA